MSKNPKGQFLNHDLPPSKAITHNYDSNEKEKKTRKTNEAEMDGRNRDLKNKQNENIFIDIQQTCSIYKTHLWLKGGCIQTKFLQRHLIWVAWKMKV